MGIQPRVFVSAPDDRHLTPDELAVKAEIISAIQRAGFEPQMFDQYGIARNLPWTYDNIHAVMRSCQGGVVLALGKWRFPDDTVLPSGFNHLEGGIATAYEFPLFIVTTLNMIHGMGEGIIARNGGRLVVGIQPDGSDVKTQGTAFWKRFEAWGNEVNDRVHIFFGYSGQAAPTAKAIITMLRVQGVKVIDWQSDFRQGASILTEIERAARMSLGGIFLFTRDDKLADGAEVFSPRDNVVFEAGYFMHAKGSQRTLIILEDGAKFLADLGGIIYVSLRDRHDIATISPQLDRFVQENL